MKQKNLHWLIGAGHNVDFKKGHLFRTIQKVLNIRQTELNKREVNRKTRRVSNDKNNIKL